MGEAVTRSWCTSSDAFKGLHGSVHPWYGFGRCRPAHYVLSQLLAPVERAAVERALEGRMEEDDEDDLLELFSRMGSHSLPPKDNMRTAIESMAHKAILQEPKFVRDSFSTVILLVQQNLPDKESVLALYESKKATGKRVVQLLDTTNVVLSRREQNVFSYLQRYIKNADQTKAEKFLRICTGSSVICVYKVMVSFNAETGLGRRPIGHMCGATLEVPCTYSSFPEFRTELDNVLSSNYLSYLNFYFVICEFFSVL